MGQLILRLTPHDFRIAWLNLLRNRRRSLLSIFIITIAVFALTTAGGFGLYTYESLKESTVRKAGHITLSQPGYFEGKEETPLDNGLSNIQAITASLLLNEEVRSVQPRIYFSGLISNGSKSNIFTGIGVNDREFDLKGPFLNLHHGKTLSNVNSRYFDPAEPQVMLSIGLASHLQVTVGDWITLLATTTDGALNALDFKVRGIYSTGIPELDKRELYVHLHSTQELLSTNKVSTISIFLYQTDLTQKVLNTITPQIKALENIEPLIFIPWWDRAFFYVKVKSLYDRIFGVLGSVMVLVVFVAVFNTMTMSVTERTREIGTLSALGTYPHEIIIGFVREASLLALLGSLFGVLLTLITSITLLFVDIQMPPPPGRTESYPLHIYFSIEFALYTTLAVLSLCVITAYLSARKGTNKPITEALIHV